MFFKNATILAIAACFCAAVLISATPTGKTNPSKSSNSPFSALKQQQQQQQIPASSSLQPQASKTNQNQVTPSFLPKPPTAPRPQPQVQQQQQQEESDASQQTQQQTEVDPNPEAQEDNPIVAVPARSGPRLVPAPAEEQEPRPEPYSFNYAFQAGDATTSGASERSEQQDASGVVRGFYTLLGNDGRARRVDYVADANGFRAAVSSNELGTKGENPADTQWAAQTPSSAQLLQADAATQRARAEAAFIPAAPALAPLAPAPAQPVFIVQNQPISAPNAPILAQIAQSQFGSAAASSNNQPSRLAPPTKTRQNPPREQFASGSSKTAQILPLSSSNLEQVQQQLQEPFEQIRQVELNARSARSTRSAPFYLFSSV